MRELREELVGRTVVFPVSGRNVERETLEGILADDG
jgi:hypothetical protein